MMWNFKKMLFVALVFCVALVVSQFSFNIKMYAYSSGDGYVNYDSLTQTWTMGTASVEKKVQLSAGNFLLTSFLNKLSNRQYIQGAIPSWEFSIKVGSAYYNGNSGGWVYDTYAASTLSQGEILLTITFHNSVIKVTQSYVVYPSTGVIQQWSDYENVSGSSQNFSYAEIYYQRIMANDVSNVDFYYMTGGANFTGSNTLKKTALTSSYTRSFDSRGTPETITVDGANVTQVTDNHGASATYHEFFALRNRSTSDGMFLMWDYNGHWGASVGNNDGGPVLLESSAQIVSYPVANNTKLTSPKSMTGVFLGDIDDMGNAITDYQYKYKWDYTRDQYFAQVHTSQLLSGAQSPNMFGTINNARYIGAQGVGIDDAWYVNQSRGDWTPAANDNFNGINMYAKKSGEIMAVWMPPYHYDNPSAVAIQHPDYKLNPDGGSGYGNHLDQSVAGVGPWMVNMLTQKQTEWGNYKLRIDGQPSFGSDDNKIFFQSQNWYNTLKSYKDTNPGAGLNGNASGGEAMSIEITRFSDEQQYTDGNVKHLSTYWISLLFPVDKLSTWMGEWPSGTSGGYNIEGHQGLHGNPYIQMQNSSAAITLADKEKFRKDVERFYALKNQGVIGRYVKTYRPTVSTGDPTFYLQHMSADQTKGFISVYSDLAATTAIGTNFTLYPKGLLAATNYTMSTVMGSAATSTHTGSYWMTTGIALAPLKDGEIIYLNLTTLPGMGSDSTAPTAPTSVTEQSGSYLGHAGYELNWQPGTDNNWISYYEIYKNGTSFDKVSIGTFYFDSTGTATDTYQVRTVDGDGNTSALVSPVVQDSNYYRASVGFSTVQGQNNWYYQQWNGSSYSNMTWDSANLQWKGAYTYNTIWSPALMHPDTNDTVRAFKAPKGGTINITGNVAKSNTSNLGDGVNVKILKNGANVWPASGWQFIAATDGAGFNPNVYVDVAMGDMVYFILNKNGNNGYDATAWDPTIVYAKNLYLPSADFSSVQGQDNWSYQQWNGSSYSNMTWSYITNQWTVPGANNVIAGPALMKPDASDTVRTWTASKSGTVNIDGNVRKAVSGGDGVNVKILKNAANVWPASGWQAIAGTDMTGFNHNVNVSVTAGDTIYFIVNKGTTSMSDDTTWDPAIRYTWKASTDFSTIQGQSNWYYQQWNGTAYTNMTWNAGTSQWTGAYTYNTIWSPALMHPDTNDTVLTWKAPKAGTITIGGNVAKSDTNSLSDGVNVKILKGATQIWPTSGWQFIAGTDAVGYTPNVSVSVAAGDQIYFILNKNVNNGYDATKWDPTISYN